MKTWLVTVALCAAAGFAIGWPWGLAVVAGCVALSLGGMWLLARLAGTCVRSGPPRREPLRVISVRLYPRTGRSVKSLPGPSGAAIAEGKRQ